MKHAKVNKPRLGHGQRHFITRIIETYKRCKYAQPVTAINCDPFGVSTKWSPCGAHYVIDIDHSVRDAVKDQPNAEELKTAWSQLVEDEHSMSCLTEMEVQLIRLLVPILQTRGISPETYFKPTRWAA